MHVQENLKTEEMLEWKGGYDGGGDVNLLGENINTTKKQVRSISH
jgi:hypothetical protein